MPAKIQINKGMVFTRLTVIKEINSIYSGGQSFRRVLCECSCGNKIKTRWAALRDGTTKSCGCYKIDKATKHGLHKHPLYNTYNNMIKRCYDTSNEYYLHYGGRGIKVCSLWRNKENGLKTFILWAEENGYKKDLEIDRINNNKSYKPSNCRWVTKTVNVNNRRNTIFVTYKGTKYSFPDFWRKFGKNKISYRTAMRRYQDEDVTAIEAVTRPSRTKNLPRRRK